MVKCASSFVILCIISLNLATSDDRVFSEKRWNIPPELTPVAKNEDSDAPQPRFLSFSGSFSLSAGSSDAHSSSVGNIKNGISLSQSQSSSSSSLGNVGSGVSVSQLDENGFYPNRPVFVDNGKVHKNSPALSHVSSSAHENNFNNQATAEAFSNKDSFQNYHSGRPIWTNIEPNYKIGGVYEMSHRSVIPQNRKKSQNWQHASSNAPPLRLNIDLDDSRFYQKYPEVVISDFQPSSDRSYGE